MLTFVLEQTHGGGHLIGRLRLSVTTRRRRSRPSTAARRDRRDALPFACRSEREAAAAGRCATSSADDDRRARLAALPPPQLVYAAARDFAADGSFKPAKRPAAGPRPASAATSRKPGRAGRARRARVRAGARAPRFDLDRPDDEGARRAALADGSPTRATSLTWRSIVNRVWHYHFGRGLVDTPNDFGRMGAPPSHPELLDWLAVEFRDDGGSLKQLHRLIVTSAVYRQIVPARPAVGRSRRRQPPALADEPPPARRRVGPRRDPAGQRPARPDDGRPVGPAVRLSAPASTSRPWSTTPRTTWTAPERRRRSVYRFLFRTLPDPFMDALDCRRRLAADRRSGTTR